MVFVDALVSEKLGWGGEGGGEEVGRGDYVSAWKKKSGGRVLARIKKSAFISVVLIDF